ncbi:MAG: hypothetical protein ACE5G1_07850, partial [bacterium]
CIQPACNWCLLNEGDCDCHENLKAGEEVCPGCGLGWHNGRGVVKGVKASQVKWGITHQHGDEGDHGNESHGEEDHGNSGHKH